MLEATALPTEPSIVMHTMYRILSNAGMAQSNDRSPVQSWSFAVFKTLFQIFLSFFVLHFGEKIVNLEHLCFVLLTYILLNTKTDKLKNIDKCFRAQKGYFQLVPVYVHTEYLLK